MLTLVLDLDGTLFSDTVLKLRPFAKEFIEHVFENFNNIAIWTAASKEHLDECLALLYPLVPFGKKFAFCWHSDKISKGIPSKLFHDNANDINGSGVFKNLRKIWKSEYRRTCGFTKNTTLLIDDNPIVFFHTRGNGIHIKTFIDDENDTELLLMIEHLKRIKIDFEKCGNVRNILK